MSHPPRYARRPPHHAKAVRAATAVLIALLTAPSHASDAKELLRLPPLIEVAPSAGPQPSRLPPPIEVLADPPQPQNTAVVAGSAELIPSVIEPIAPIEAPPGPVVEPLGAIGFCEFCGESCGRGAACSACQSAGPWGRFTRAVYRGLCCPDPCYNPTWRPLADTAFFTAAVRPQNQQRFRWDFAEDLIFPDRAEYFWQTRSTPPTAVDYDELRHYTEVAHGAFGAWFEYSYRSLDADGAHAAGFGDMTVGTKSLLFDTELVQVAFQFATHIPQGLGSEGLGTGHASLEPGLIFGLALTPLSYLQAELTEWIPLGGDDDTAGALFRYNVAYNRVLWRPHPWAPLIGSVELNGWRFQDGGFNDPALSPTFRPASGESYLHGSAGVRLFICDRADFGVSYSTPVTSGGWADTLVRTELRFRY